MLIVAKILTNFSNHALGYISILLKIFIVILLNPMWKKSIVRNFQNLKHPAGEGGVSAPTRPMLKGGPAGCTRFCRFRTKKNFSSSSYLPKFLSELG